MGLINISHKDSDKKPTRYYSTKQEKEVAKTLNGQRTLNSGATPFQKGDLTINKFLIECKTKMSPSESISIKKEWLKKNDKEALFMGKEYSTLCFNFGPGEKNYYIISEELFQNLVDKLEEDN